MASGSVTGGGFLPCVILPCDLPWWWTEIVPQLEKARDAETTKELIDAMQRLIHTCNVSIDAIPPRRDPLALSTLRRWLDEHLDPAEFQHYFKRTIPRIAQWAIDLKIHKPTGGLCFSLQQFEGETEHSYKFIAALVANAFFSTYAMRTPTSHPSLRDFNFTGFFKHLLLPSQQAKLRCLFRYFDYLDEPGATEGKILISRQVLKSENWLTIEDWAESKVPLCDLTIKYDGRMEDSEIEYCSKQKQQQQKKKSSPPAPVQVCFASKHVGSRVLQEGCNQECIQFITHPELLPILLMFESLEDNEALIVKGARFIGTISNPKSSSGRFVPCDDPQPVTMCCIDPDDFSTEPYLQYLDFNILRELNKSMLGFRQRRAPVEKKTGSAQPTAPAIPSNNNNGNLEATQTHNISRLSPIGEQSSAQSTPSKKDIVNSKPADKDEKEISKENAQDGKDRAAERENNIKNSDNGREKEKEKEEVEEEEESSGNGFSLLKAKRRAFIVLHSSREKLPIRRKSWADAACSTSTVNSSASLSTESFHSAKENLSSATSSKSSFDTDSSCSDHHQAGGGAPNGHETRVRRKSFAQRLQSAVEREEKAIRSNGDSVSLPAHPDDLQQQQQQPLPDAAGDGDGGDVRPVAAAAAARPLQMVAHRAYISEDRGEEDGRTLQRRLSTGFHLMDGPESDEMLRRSFEDLRGFGQEFQEEAKEVLTHAIETWKRKMSAPATTTTREVVPTCNDIGCDQQVFDLTHRLLKRALSEPQADTTKAAAAERQQQQQKSEEDEDDVQHRYKFLLTIKSLSLEMARRRSSVDSNFTSRSMENGNDHYCAYATNNNNHPKQHDLNELLIDDSIDDYGNDHQLVKNGGGDCGGGPRSCMKPYVRQRSRNRLKAVAFTSEVYQTLFEDETTVALPVTAPTAPSVVVACNGGSGAANGHETYTGLKISRETSPGNDEDAAAALLPVVTGNWGCGRRYRGEHQLKLFVQWMSASMAGVPRLVYYTRGRDELANLEHIKRTLAERRCTVGDLVAEARRYAESVLREAQQSVHGAGDQPPEARLDEVRSSSRLISSLFEGTIENARRRF